MERGGRNTEAGGCGNGKNSFASKSQPFFSHSNSVLGSGLQLALDSWKSHPFNRVMSDYELVYSDDPNFKKRCPKCSKYPCACPKASDMRPGEHTLKIRLEKNGRGGKTVTVVFELPVNEEYFKGVEKKLKALCGTGGSYKNNVIEIQGDHREKIKSHLEKLGFKVKLAGG